MTIVELEVKRVSICPCGHRTLQDNIPVGTIYKVDLESIAQGCTYFCGGCGKHFFHVLAINAEHKRHVDWPYAPLPLALFTDDAGKMEVCFNSLVVGEPSR